MLERLALLVMWVGCRKEGSDPPAAGPRLFTEDEVAAYESRVMARLAETAKSREAAVADQLQGSLDTRDRARVFAPTATRLAGW